MKKALLSVLVLGMFLQLGCTKSMRYSADEINGFPPNIQEHIQNGEVAIGMTTQQVRYAWGAPSSIKSLEPVDGKAREEWMYTTLGIIGTRLLLFYDGKLLYVSD
jgi:hypothetical protein